MATLAKVWADRLIHSRKKEKKWRALGRKVVKRYRDEQGRDRESKYNILYANTSVLQPALFSQLPRPDVRRTLREGPGATAAEIIERALTFYKDDPQFARSVRQARDDMLLPGRGVVRVKYESDFDQIGLTKEDIDPETGETLVEARYVDDFGVERYPSDSEIKQGYVEEKSSEKCWVEYVYWEDFACSDVRNWEDVTWIGFRNVLSEVDAKDLFGKKAELLEAPTHEKKEGDIESSENEFEVWEIWDKNTRKRYWISPGSEKFFFKEDDPYGLRDFFPCPKPLYGIETTDCLIPIPPYIQYESQAVGLDDNTKRQSAISKAMKMVGIYAGDQGEVMSQIREAEDGDLVPVELMDKSLRESVSWLPIEHGAVALQQLMLREANLEAKVRQISGVSDIMRGETKEREPNKTQQLKLSTGSLRLRPMREQVEEFIRDIYRIKGEIISEKYSPETLKKITGIDVTPEVLIVLGNQELRDFRIDIETDSTVQPDAQQEKQEMAEFIGALSPMLQQIAAIGQVQPMAVPVLLQVMNSFLRTFKVDPKIEGELEKLSQTIIEAAQQPKGPSEVEIKEQAETERVKMREGSKLKQQEIDKRFTAEENQRDRDLKAAEIAAKGLQAEDDAATRSKVS